MRKSIRLRSLVETTSTRDPAVEEVKSKYFSTKKGKIKQKDVKRRKIDAEVFVPPLNWRETYEVIKRLRNRRDAPVDSMGSEALPEKIHGLKVYRFQVMCCLLLSSQTKDQQVSMAIKKMQTELKPFLGPESIIGTSEEKISKLIYGVGFYKNKAKYLKKVAAVSKEKYDGDIPSDSQKLIKDFPGIGPKMAYITLNVAFGRPFGIGVDVSSSFY